jgi:hypothetical protein
MTQKYNLLDHPNVAFAWGNIKYWNDTASYRSSTWDIPARMYEMRETPDETEDSSSRDEDILEAGSAELFGFVDTLVALIVPPKPAARIRAFGNDPRFVDQADARSAVVKEYFRRDKFAKKLRKVATRACIYPRAFLKAVWDEARDRPRFRVIRPHNIYFDQTVDEWEDVRWICEVVPRTRGEIESHIGGKGKARIDHPFRPSAKEDLKDVQQTYPSHLAHLITPDDSGYGATTNHLKSDKAAALKAYHWLVTYEYYDLVGEKHYIFAEGVDEPLYEGPLPYSHLKNPYHLVTFLDNLVDCGGMSPANLVIRLISNLNNLSSLELQYGAKSIPKEFIDEGKLDNPAEFLEDYANADGAKDIIRAPTTGNQPLAAAFHYSQTPPFAMEFTTAKEECRRSIISILAIHPLGRSQMGSAEHATEAAIEDAALRNRNHPREEVIYDAIAWSARAVVGLLRQFMKAGDRAATGDEELPQSIPVELPSGELKRYDAIELGLTAEDEPFAFQYEAHPYDALAEDDIAQLKKLEKLLPVFQQWAAEGIIDVHQMASDLAEMLHFPNWVTPKDQLQAQAAATQPMAGQTPGVPNMPGMGAGDPSIEEQMAGGEVMSGTGGLSGNEMTAPPGMNSDGLGSVT